MPKKVFLVSRKSEIDWDEYDSCVIVAASVEEIEQVIECCDNYWDYGPDDRDIKEIDLNTHPSEVLLGSFNAG